LHVEVEANRDTGLDDVCYVQCELIRSVNHNRLSHRMGSVDGEVSSQVGTILRTLMSY
jgi:mRNA-degrading endonuclease toxin of MazEF toxin-antitoxin module